MTDTMTETNTAASDAALPRRREVEGLRRASDLLCLWRVCGNAACRRARSCRGRAQLCARRNTSAVPSPARDFFVTFLAAQYAGLPFEDFRADMEGREETAAFFAWRNACGASRR
ncbi:hypothetical protein [Methyloceanibacter sp.]|uniref:hypothetical protein n=1 Tax=Methyloceanibacter sp. TaxID=1965321 RepID=UPI003D6D06D8